MADIALASDDGNAQNYFLLRRLHSLSGIIPLGVFLFVHLATNASILGNMQTGEEFQRSVDRIHALGPLLVPVEIVGIFIPLLFHVIAGIVIAMTAKHNAASYRYGGNIRYTLQRVTAYIALVFIAYHLYQMHWVGKPFPGGGQFEYRSADGAGMAATTTAMTIQQAWYVVPLYAIGILATVFHLANGIWTALITWGLTIRPASQRAAGYVCAAFGILIGLAGLGALYGFKTFKVEGEHADPHQTTAVTASADALASNESG